MYFPVRVFEMNTCATATTTNMMKMREGTGPTIPRPSARNEGGICP